MDVVNNDKEEFKLPKPGQSSGEAVAETSAEIPNEAVASAKVEKQSSSGPGLPSTVSSVPASMAQGQPLATDPLAAVLPAMADDNDLIEKEWVIKAKQIVEQTKDDPRAQTKAIGQVKANYLKRRFDKDIKASEG